MGVRYQKVCNIEIVYLQVRTENMIAYRWKFAFGCCIHLVEAPVISKAMDILSIYNIYIYTQPKHITFIVTDQPKNKAGAESNSAVQYMSWNQRTGIDLRSRGNCSIYEI